MTVAGCGSATKEDEYLKRYKNAVKSGSHDEIQKLKEDIAKDKDRIRK
jgi:hypothetical protein